MKVLIEKDVISLNFSKEILSHLPLLSSATMQVDLPQNGAKSHDLPGSTVAQRVDAKHIPGKSIKNNFQRKRMSNNFFSLFMYWKQLVSA